MPYRDGVRKKLTNWRSRTDAVLETIFGAMMKVISLPYCRVYSRTTFDMAVEILESANKPEDIRDAILRDKLACWSHTKIEQARYVQVAAAVFLTISTGCLGSAVLAQRHWSAPALWSVSIVLSISSIFSGAQQTLVLPEANEVRKPCKFSNQQLAKVRNSFAVSDERLDEISDYALFAWQMPIMMLSYAVVTFLAGLCSAMLSPLIQNPHWNSEAKAALMFCFFSVLALASWIFPFYRVHGFDDARIMPKTDGEGICGARDHDSTHSSITEYLQTSHEMSCQVHHGHKFEVNLAARELEEGSGHQ